MSALFIDPSHDNDAARLRRRLDQLARLPIPAKGRDSQRRAQHIIETLTELQNARYIARLNDHG